MVESIINSVDMNLSKLWEIADDGEAWHAAIHGDAKSQRQQQQHNVKILKSVMTYSFLQKFWRN